MICAVPTCAVCCTLNLEADCVTAKGAFSEEGAAEVAAAGRLLLMVLQAPPLLLLLLLLGRQVAIAGAATAG